MKRNILLGAVMLCATSLVAADAASDVKAAAKKLSEKGNYSWKSNAESAGGAVAVAAAGTVSAVRPRAKTDAGTIQLSMTRGENTTEAVSRATKAPSKRRKAGNRSRQQPKRLVVVAAVAVVAGGGAFLARSLTEVTRLRRLRPRTWPARPRG
jgi:hypothetical protein